MAASLAGSAVLLATPLLLCAQRVTSAGLARSFAANAPAAGESSAAAGAPAPAKRSRPGLAVEPLDAGAGLELDSVVASVDGQAITSSEVDDAAWYARLVARLHKTGAAAPDPLRPAERSTALSHLIDERLVLQAEQRAGARVDQAALQQRVDEQIAALRQLSPAPAGLAGALAATHLDLATVRAILGTQISELDFLQQRLGAGIMVEPKEVEAYYRQQFVPAARAHHWTPAPLAKVQDQIRQLLEQRQLNELVQQWLRTLRASASIEQDAASAH